jgi:hypothetical protein
MAKAKKSDATLRVIEPHEVLTALLYRQRQVLPCPYTSEQLYMRCLPPEVYQSIVAGARGNVRNTNVGRLISTPVDVVHFRYGETVFWARAVPPRPAGEEPLLVDIDDTNGAELRKWLDAASRMNDSLRSIDQAMTRLFDKCLMSDIKRFWPQLLQLAKSLGATIVRPTPVPHKWFSLLDLNAHFSKPEREFIMEQLTASLMFDEKPLGAWVHYYNH